MTSGKSASDRHRLVRLVVICWLAVTMLSVTPSPAFAQQQPTYGGRSFDRWQWLATADLEVETRLKAMLAIGALGQDGRRDEAIQTLNVALQRESDPLVRSAAYLALLTFGNEATSAIRDGFRSSDPGERKITLYAVADFFAPLDSEPGQILQLPTSRQLAKSSKLPDQIIPPLLKILASDSVTHRDRQTAARALGGIYSSHPSEALAERTRKVAVDVAGDTDVELSAAAIRLLGRMGKHARAAVPFLADVAARQEKVVQPRALGQRTLPERYRLLSRPIAATNALTDLGAFAEEALPTLERLQGIRSGREVYVAGLAARAVRRIRAELDAGFPIDENVSETTTDAEPSAANR